MEFLSIPQPLQHTSNHQETANSSSNSPNNQENTSIDSLPNEILKKIFDFVRIEHTAGVCKKWRNFSYFDAQGRLKTLINDFSEHSGLPDEVKALPE